jgi:hypothetical protein
MIPILSIRLVLVLALLGAGCVETNAPFVIAERPAVQEDGKHVYLIHVGDRPTLRFGGRSSSPDYAVIKDETTGRYEDAGVSLTGIFEWRRQFNEVTPGDGTMTLTALGYQQKQHRDFMPVDGQMEESDPTFDAPDELVACGTLHVRVYQSRIVIEVPPREDEVDWTLSWLDLKTVGGRRTRLRHSNVPQPNAFSAVRNEATGGWRVEYEPTLDQVEPEGTQVELNVADRYGRPTKIEQTWSAF